MRIRLTRFEASIFAFAAGVFLAFWLFGLAFTRSYADFYRDAVPPLTLAMLGAGVLGGLAPRSWPLVAASMTLPTAVMDVKLFLAVKSEGRGLEWSDLAMIAAVAVVALIGAVAGSLVRWMIKKS